MKKIGLVFGLVIPLIIALPVDAKNARRISVKTASSIPTSAHSLSGRATKKSHIKLVVGKHVLGKTNANSLGKFKIKLKHRLSLNKKYYLIASKKGYKQSKVLISLYKVEKNKNVKNATSNNKIPLPTTSSSNATSNNKIPSPTTSSSNGASKPNTPKYVTSPGGKVTESASAPFDNGITHKDGDVWFVQDSNNNTTAIYSFNNGNWQLENSADSYIQNNNYSDQIIIPKKSNNSSPKSNADDKGYFTTSSMLAPDDSMDSHHKDGDVWYQKNDSDNTCAVYIYINNSWKKEAYSLDGNSSEISSELDGKIRNIDDIYPAGIGIPKIIYLEYESLNYAEHSVEAATDF